MSSWSREGFLKRNIKYVLHKKYKTKFKFKTIKKYHIVTINWQKLKSAFSKIWQGCINQWEYKLVVILENNSVLSCEDVCPLRVSNSIPR